GVDHTQERRRCVSGHNRAGENQLLTIVDGYVLPRDAILAVATITTLKEDRFGLLRQLVCLICRPPDARIDDSQQSGQPSSRNQQPCFRSEGHETPPVLAIFVSTKSSRGNRRADAKLLTENRNEVGAQKSKAARVCHVKGVCGRRRRVD